MNDLMSEYVVSMTESQEQLAAHIQKLCINIERLTVKVEEGTKSHDKNFERMSQEISSIDDRLRKIEHLEQLDVSPRLRAIEDAMSQQKAMNRVIGLIASSSLCGVIAEFIARLFER